MLRSLATAVLVATLMTAAPVSAAQEPPQAAQKPSPDAPLNINTATAAALEALPGIGAATAARIIEYRQKNGAFKKVEDLMNVRGIGEKTFLSLKPLITVAPPKGAGI